VEAEAPKSALLGSCDKVKEEPDEKMIELERRIHYLEKELLRAAQFRLDQKKCLL